MNNDDLRELLAENELEFFNSLAPSYQKIFVQHAFGAKREETRLRNLEEVKEALNLKCKNIFDYKKKINPKKKVDQNQTDADKLEAYFAELDEDNRDLVEKLYRSLLLLDKDLTAIYAWNQPMIKYKETFVIAFSTAKAHFSIAPDVRALELFSDQIEQNGYDLLKKGFKIKYNQPINNELIEEIVKYTISIKQDATGFWN